MRLSTKLLIAIAWCVLAMLIAIALSACETPRRNSGDRDFWDSLGPDQRASAAFRVADGIEYSDGFLRLQ